MSARRLPLASPEDVGRREMMRLMAAAVAMTTAACTRAPKGDVVPYVTQPPEVHPGAATRYATALLRGGLATGVLVESHEGRPTKIEGNPAHPASLGGTGAAEQATVLGLYDPKRARGVRSRGDIVGWSELAKALAGPDGADAHRGAGLHVVIPATGSPLLADLVHRVRGRLPAAAIHFHGEGSRTAAWSGARVAFGRVLEPRFDLTRADVIVALDADFLTTRADSLRLARQLTERRQSDARTSSAAASRLYVAESTLTVTGASADERRAVRSSDVLAIGAALLAAVIGQAEGVSRAAVDAIGAWRERASAHRPWIEAVARDLLAHRGRSAIVVGDGQPAALHAIAHALDAALGNVGGAVTLAPPAIVDAGDATHDLAPLSEALALGKVDRLVVLDGDPAFTAARGLKLAERIPQARVSVYLGRSNDATARACTFHVAAAHALESWGLERAFDGTVSVVQPLIEPMHEGRTAGELLALLLGDVTTSPRDLARDVWRRGGHDDAAWAKALRHGVAAGTEVDAVAPPPLAWPAIASLAIAEASPRLEATFRLDPRVGDGAHADSAWLQEVPDPITKLTWGNAITLSPATATALGVATGDVVDVALGAGRARGPVLVVPGHADGSLGFTHGHGRVGEGVGSGVGFDAAALFATPAPSFDLGAAVTKTGARVALAIAQPQGSLEGRDESVLHHGTLAEHRANPPPGLPRSPASLYEHPPSAARQWGMVIDLAACTGCSACVVACQAENNVPVVGPTGILAGRAMHWMRIDRYFVGPATRSETLMEPMLCQHCEKAPCEYVCPVNATTHSEDGLNQMTYNRCVGTRFCSNNCPYKVRRFNWFDYQADVEGEARLVMNPDVTVRARGVMEKCTYCVQRIREAEIHAEVARRPLVDGDVVTACEEACPSAAIVFGDIRDPSSRVARLRQDPRAFSVLGELGTLPRTTYLARLRNPNAELA